MEIIHIKDPIYNANIWMIYNCSLAEYKDWLLLKFKFDSPLDYDDISGFATRIRYKAKNHFIIWIRNFNGSLESIGTIVHEVNHATMRVMELYCCINGNDEALVYYNEYIIKKIFKKLHIGVIT
jgi:hypothetical protein